MESETPSVLETHLLALEMDLLNHASVEALPLRTFLLSTPTDADKSAFFWSSVETIAIKAGPIIDHVLRSVFRYTGNLSNATIDRVLDRIHTVCPKFTAIAAQVLIDGKQADDDSWVAPRWLRPSPTFGARIAARPGLLTVKETEDVLQDAVARAEDKLGMAIIKASALITTTEKRVSDAGSNRRRTVNRTQSPMRQRRDRIMFLAIKQGLEGAAYCKFLDGHTIAIPPEWVSGGCPKSYALAYTDKAWRKRIYDEKNRANVKLGKLDPSDVRRVLGVIEHRTAKVVSSRS